MKIKCTVVGVGERKSGVGKRSGQAYDFTEVSCVYPKPGTNGNHAETFAINTSLLSGREIAPGDEMEMIIHQANFKSYVDYILE